MNLLGLTPTSEEVEKMVAEIDLDGNGTVDFDEFLQVMAGSQNYSYTKKDLMRAFKLFAKGENAGWVQSQGRHGDCLKRRRRAGGFPVCSRERVDLVDSHERWKVAVEAAVPTRSRDPTTFGARFLTARAAL